MSRKQSWRHGAVKFNRATQDSGGYLSIETKKKQNLIEFVEQLNIPASQYIISTRACGKPCLMVTLSDKCCFEVIERFGNLYAVHPLSRTETRQLKKSYKNTCSFIWWYNRVRDRLARLSPAGYV